MSTQTDQKFSNNFHQYIAAITANLIFMSHGTMIGWMSPATPILLSNETPLKTGPLTNDELSWIGSINAIGAILSTFTFGFISVWLGCKRAILFLSVPSVVFYILIFFGDTYYYLLLARFFTGWSGGGIQTTLILYIAEIANNDIRGTLGSFSHISRNIGLLLAYVIGAVVQYQIVPCIFIAIPIIFAILFFLLPNTPQYHLKKGNLDKAEKSLKFYKGIKNDSVSEYPIFKAEFERLKTLANDQKVEEKLQLKDFMNGPAIRGVSSGLIMASLAYLTGYLVFTTYAVVIFEEAGASNIDPYVSSIVLAVLQLIGNLCTTTFSDTLGRKALLIISLLGSALGMFTFASYSYLRQTGYDVTAFEVVPVVSLSFVIFMASAGVVPLMFLCMVENVPSKIRTVGLTICNVFMNMVSFTTLKLFPIFLTLIGLHGCMMIFGISCTIGCFYVFFVIKETKGISLDTQKKVPKENTDENC